MLKFLDDGGWYVVVWVQGIGCYGNSLFVYNIRYLVEMLFNMVDYSYTQGTSRELASHQLFELILSRTAYKENQNIQQHAGKLNQMGAFYQASQAHKCCYPFKHLLRTNVSSGLHGNRVYGQRSQISLHCFIIIHYILQLQLRYAIEENPGPIGQQNWPCVQPARPISPQFTSIYYQRSPGSLSSNSNDDQYPTLPPSGCYPTTKLIELADDIQRKQNDSQRTGCHAITSEDHLHQETKKTIQNKTRDQTAEHPHIISNIYILMSPTHKFFFP